MESIEAPPFTRRVADYLDDESYRSFQEQLAASPLGGDLIPGTGGLRKIRWRDARRGKGTRGGLRVIYFYFEAEHQIWLMTLYSKGEISDLSIAEKKTLKAAIGEELRSRAERRGKRSRRRS